MDVDHCGKWTQIFSGKAYELETSQSVKKRNFYQPTYILLRVKMTLKVTQGHQNCLYSTGYISLAISGLYSVVTMTVSGTISHIYSVRDWL